MSCFSNLSTSISWNYVLMSHAANEKLRQKWKGTQQHWQRNLRNILASSLWNFWLPKKLKQIKNVIGFSCYWHSFRFCLVEIWMCTHAKSFVWWWKMWLCEQICVFAHISAWWKVLKTRAKMKSCKCIYFYSCDH